MSITNEKLQTIKDNVSKVYRSGQMDVIKNANSLKGFESSKAILLDDISPVEHEMEVRVHGKNLFDVSQVESTTGLTNNGNGTLTVTEYAIGSTLLKTICPALKVGETYILTFTTTGVALIYLNSANIPWYPGKSLTITEAMLNSRVLFYCKRVDGVNAEAVISDIQIELGTTATDYEPYNNDIQNVHSKNLIPFPYTGLQNVGVTEETNGVNFTLNEDGSVLIDGTASTGTVKYIYQNTKDLLGLKSGDVITGSKYVSDSSQLSNFNLIFNYYDSTTKMKDGMTLGSITNKTITITDDYIGWGIYIYIPSGNTISNLLVKPQLELGSTATYYEKYHEPYPLVVSRYGKNLFSLANRTWANFGANDPTAVRNISKDNFYFKIAANNYAVNSTTNYEIIDGNSIKITTTNAYGLGVPFHLIAGQQYTISCIKSDDIKCRINIGYYDIEGIYLSGKYDVSTFTMPENAYWVILCFVGFISSGTAEELTFTNIQLELGSTATDYEPYKECAEYTPTTDGVISGVKNLYPNTTLISNGDRVYIDCNYYKDVDKAYNKLSAEIALSGGE